MTFLPIVARELRVAARRRGTPWARAMVALLAIIIGAFFYAAHPQVPAQFIARDIFNGLLTISMIYCLLSGRFFTADCLSSEKREGTLGLLFLTDLKGYDVVLGKLAANSVNALYGLLAVVPVLAISLLMGGVTNGEVWRAVLALVNTFLFSLAIGVFVSVWSFDARKAMGANLLLLLVPTAILPAAALFYELARLAPPGPRMVPVLLLPCPVFGLIVGNDDLYWGKRLYWYYWGSFGIIHALTWLLVGLASWRVRYCWQDRPASANPSRWRNWKLALTYGSAAMRKAFRKRLLNINAYYWLVARARFKPVHVWALLAFIAGWWVWSRWKFGASWFHDAFNPVNLATAVLLNVSLKLWVALEAGRQLAEDHKAGAFELLLPTPLSERRIVRGQFLALRRQFLGPLLAVVAVELLFMIPGVRHGSRVQSMALAIWTASIVLLLADLAAVSWVAMAAALTARNPNHASVLTVWRILILPMVAYFTVMAITAAVYSFMRRPEPTWKFFLAWWTSLGLAADLAYGSWAWWQLRTRFRQLAAREVRPKNARWAWLSRT